MASQVESIKRILNHNLVKNTGFMFLVQVSSYLFPLISLPYLSRVLSKESLGLVSHTQVLIWYFISLTEYGFNLTATRDIAVSRQSPQAVNRIFSEVMGARLLLTVLGLFILIALVLVTPSMRVHMDLYLMAFLSVIGTFLFPLWLYQGMEKMRDVAIRDFVAKLLSLAALVLLVRRADDYRYAVLAQSSGVFLAGIVGFPLMRKLGVRFETPSWDGVKRQLHVGWPAFSSLSLGAIGMSTNMFLLGLRSEVEMAEFSVAQRIIAAMRSLVNPISAAMYPHTSKKAAQSEVDVILFVRKYAWWFAAPFLAGGLLLMVGAPWLVPLLLGDKYVPSILVLQIMAMIPALLTFTQSYSTYYMLACGYDKPWMKIMIGTTLINFVVLIPSLFLMRGAVALAVTALVAEASGAAWYSWFYHRRAKELLPREQQA